MDLGQLRNIQGFSQAGQVYAAPALLKKPVPPTAEPSAEAPRESFSPSTPAPPAALPQVETPLAEKPPASLSSPTTLTWQQGSVTFSGTGNGPIASLEEAGDSTPILSGPVGLNLADQLKGLGAVLDKPPSGAAKAMAERENGYLSKFPYKDDEKALKARADLTTRYNDPTTSAESMTQTVTRHAQERGIDIDALPDGLPTGDLSKGNLDQVKKAAQGMVDKLFLSQEASFNPEKHATVTQQTNRFLELALQAAPKGFTTADAHKLVAGNLALISYQDKAAAENMLGDHGVRHLLGHNINACEQLADGLEKQGTFVGSMDRLVMHQAMIVHDLGYAMDSVRNPINTEGLKGQDAGHNVLAARYLRERSQNPDDPLAKLFGQGDLERMHRCVLFHDKDQNGGPGVTVKLSAIPSEEDRATNLETMTRVADNSHAFEDKLPELLYRKPQSLKTLRLMKTAGELGDKGLVDTLKGELAELVKTDPSLAKDDREALLMSVGSVTPKSYQFSVGRIAGSKPTFDIGSDGKIHLSVRESSTHQQTVSLFGMESYGQMEKFIKDCAGEKVTLKGDCEVIDGKQVCIQVQGAPAEKGVQDLFNAELQKDLLADKQFTRFCVLDTQLSSQQSILEIKHQLLTDKGGSTADLDTRLEGIKGRRKRLLDGYRSTAQVAGS